MISWLTNLKELSTSPVAARSLQSSENLLQAELDSFFEEAGEFRRHAGFWLKKLQRSIVTWCGIKLGEERAIDRAGCDAGKSSIGRCKRNADSALKPGIRISRH